MISLLYQPNPPFEQPDGCGPGRTENSKRYIKNGKIYTSTEAQMMEFVLRWS